MDVAVSSDGGIYIADSTLRVFRVGPDGRINVIAGKLAGPNAISGDYSGDGGPAIDAQVAPISVEVSSDGSLFIADGSNRIRRVGPDGIITTAAGNGVRGYSGDGGLAKQAEIVPNDVAVTPDGNFYISSSDLYEDGYNRVRRAGSLLPGFRYGDFIIPAEDGSALFVFDSSGRHSQAINALTGSTIYEFIYDPQGRLTEVRDAFDNVAASNGTSRTNSRLLSPRRTDNLAGGRCQWFAVQNHLPALPKTQSG